MQSEGMSVSPGTIPYI